MNFPVMLFIFGAGYVSGLSVSSGLLLRAIFISHIQGGGGVRNVSWLLFLLFNTVLAGVTVIFMAVITVTSNEILQGEFIYRAVLFLLGLFSAAAFVFFSFHLIDLNLRRVGVDIFGKKVSGTISPSP